MTASPRREITYDQETATITIRLKDIAIAECDELQEGMVADFDEDGNIVGLEIFDGSKRGTQRQNLIFESKGHPVTDSAAA